MLSEEEQSNTFGRRLLAVIGPSGSGKSSVVMAGLLPQLWRGALSNSDEWVYLPPIVPGRRPFEALVSALALYLPRRSFQSIRQDLDDDASRGLHMFAASMIDQPGRKVVLFIDQFEEIFTQSDSEEERERFINLILTAVTEPRGPLLIIITLRADFYGYPMRFPELQRLIETSQYSILPLSVKDLRKVIERPAMLPDVQLRFEGDLIGDLLFDTYGQSGTLPLLQFTLDLLFRYRRGRYFTLEAYDRIGGVKGALTLQATTTYKQLRSQQHRWLALLLFARLVHIGIGEQDITRRRANLDELALPDPRLQRTLQEVLEAFTTARLLTVNKSADDVTRTVEVAHEALIHEWEELWNWLVKNRDGIRLQQKIYADAWDWVQKGKPEDRLYQGGKLSEAEKWVETNLANQVEKAFILASGEYTKGKKKSKRRSFLTFPSFLRISLLMKEQQQLNRREVLLRKQLQEAYNEQHTLVGEQQTLLSEVDRLYREQAAAAVTDMITGLPNYRAVLSQCDEEIGRYTRLEQAFALVKLDVDRLKQINDTWGRRVGDAVLCEVGKRLHATLGSKNFVCRYADYEFIVLLANAQEDLARRIAEELR